MFNSNAIHNVLNAVIWILGLLTAVALYAGCTQLPNGALDCMASTVIPPSWLPYIVTITTAAAALKTVINIAHDGFSGLFKRQPPVTDAPAAKTFTPSRSR